MNVYLGGWDGDLRHGDRRHRWPGHVIRKQDVVDSIDTASDVHVADNREEEEVGVDPALNISELVSLPSGHPKQRE